MSCPVCSTTFSGKTGAILIDLSCFPHKAHGKKQTKTLKTVFDSNGNKVADVTLTLGVSHNSVNCQSELTFPDGTPQGIYTVKLPRKNGSLQTAYLVELP